MAALSTRVVNLLKCSSKFRPLVNVRNINRRSEPQRKGRSPSQRNQRRDTEYQALGFRLVKTLKDKFSRNENNLVLLEGWRLINDAYEAGGSPVQVLFSDEALLKHLVFQPPKDCLVSLSQRQIKEISSTVTPQGIIAVFSKPNASNIAYANANIPVTIVCDGLKDPNNLGSIIRGCAAAGCESIITSKTSVDAWDPKVIRGGAGGHFRVPVVDGCSWEVISEMIPEETKVFLADGPPSDKERNLRSSSTSYSAVDWTQGPSALIIGQESSGLSDEARIFGIERRAQYLHIPMSHGVNSLSAAMATSIIVFEAVRQVTSKRHEVIAAEKDEVQGPPNN